MPDLVPVKRGTPAAKDDKQAAEPAASSMPQRYWRSDPFFAPFREFDELWDRTMSRFFGGPAGAGWTGNWAPLVDLEETDSEWIFEVELPGVDRDDVRVEVTDSELSISGETKERERAGVLRHRTRRTGSFHYRTTLPAGVDPDKVAARLDSGVLTVRVPRPEHARVRRIKIQ